MAATKYLFITALTAVIFTNAINSSPLLGKVEESYRLNNKVTPTNYEIELTTDIKNSKIEGEVHILLKAFEETDMLRFHAVDLVLSDLSLSVAEKPEDKIDIKKNEYQKEGQFWVAQLGNNLTANTDYIFTMKFKGNMRKEGERGYYLLKFKSGETDKVMAVTYLEPIYARTVFPCFDEPQLKATFNVTLTHDKDYDAYSNSKSKKASQKLQDATTVTTAFEQTPLMSTYLLAFALLPTGTFFEHDAGDKRTNVLVRNDIKDQVKYLLPKTTSYLKALEDLTGVNYDKTVGKVTHLTIPTTVGGMENWGLIVYGEVGVVYDESNHPFSQTLAGQRVIAHELAHQWFGNLVTPKWWTDLWLKEGLASYMELIVMDTVEEGEYGSLREYFAQVHHRYLKEDSSKGARAMNKQVETPKDIINNFDVVQYEKGSQLLYMLEHIIGSKLFKEGVQYYVKQNQYKSVTPDDLWDALQKTIDNSKKEILGGKKVAEIGNSWLSQAGYPVVHVSINTDKGKLKFTQKRFLNDSKESIWKKSRWIIPINFITDKTEKDDVEKTAPTHWLEKKTLELDMDDVKFVIANNDQTGYYRVNYDDSNWKAISDHLSSEDVPILSTVTKAQLLDDAFTLAENGDLKYDVAIDLSRFLEKSDEFLPWKPTSVYLIDIYDKISMTPTLKNYQKYLSKISKKAFEKVLFETDYENKADGILQERLLPLIVRAKSPQFIEKSKELLSELKDESSVVVKKFQRYVFCGAANQESEFLIGELKDENSKHEMDDILFGLSCLSAMDDIKKVLEAIKKEDDKFTFVKYVVELNPLMVYENNEEFTGAISNEAKRQEILEILASRIGTEEQIEALKELNVEGKYDKFLELAENNYKWNKDNEDFHKWVEDNKDPENPESTTKDPSDGALNVAICFSMLLSTVIFAILM